MRAVDAFARHSPALRVTAAAAAVAIAGGAAALYGADVAQAALFLLVAVVVGSLGGRRVGVVTAVGAAVVLNVAFTPPRGTLTVDDADDGVALVVFTVVALSTSTLMTAATQSRHVAERRARAAELALELTGRLRGGDDPAEIARELLAGVLALFGLSSARLLAGGVDVTVGDRGDRRTAIVVAAPLARLEAVPRVGTDLTRDDRAVLESLVAHLSGALERLALERDAELARVAAEVSRTRAGFLSAVSHNLRTPLAAINAASSTLLAPDAVLDDGARRELLETVRDETRRLEHLVAKVLDLGVIRAGGLELVPQPVDVEGLLQAAVHRLAPLLGTRRITVAADADLDEVTLDPVALEQVLLNLLENAVHHTPDGTAIDVVAARRRGQLEVRVTDDGPGVAPEERERVFEEFYRSSSRAESEGTGLGLAIVKAIVTAQRGRVWIEDAPGGGASFVVRLPRVMPE